MKPGTKTSEFWLVLVALGAILLQGPLNLTIPEGVHEWLIGMIIAYGAGRSGVKGLAEHARKRVEVTGLERDPAARGSAVQDRREPSLREIAS